jgi:opacity protein-like surface antigen
MRLTALAVPIIVVMLFLASGFAVAAEEGTPPEAEAAAGSEGAVEGEISSSTAYEADHEETLRETYFRITDNFIRPQYLGLGDFARVPAWPPSILKVGAFRLAPFLSAEAGWTSNVFLKESGERQSSWWVGARGGLIGDAKFASDRLHLKTVLELFYKKYTQQDKASDWEGLAGVSLRYTFPAGWWLESGITYLRVFDPIDEEDVPSRAKQDRVDFHFDVGFDQLFQRTVGSRWTFKVGVDLKTRNFSDDAFETGNRNQAVIRARLGYYVLKEMQVYAEYRYTITDAKNKRINDGRAHEFRIGTDGAYPIAAGRLQGKVYLGYRRDAFDGPDVIIVGKSPELTDDNDKTDRLIAGLQLRYLPGSRTTLTFRYRRNTDFSTQGNFQYSDRIDLDGQYLIIQNLPVRAGGYVDWAQPSTGGKVTRYGVGAGARYRFIDNLDADLSWQSIWRNDDRGENGSEYVEHRFVLGLTFYIK